MEYGFGFYFSWWYSIIFIVFNYGLNFIFQHSFRIRFNKVPHIKIYSTLNTVFFYLIIFYSLILKFESIAYLVLGSIVFITGLSIYVGAMFYFAINEFDKPVTNGVYKLSRHPLYLGFFILYFGVFISTLDIVVLILNFLIAFTSYKISLKEEDDCELMYLDEYKEYKENVKRIINFS